MREVLKMKKYEKPLISVDSLYAEKPVAASDEYFFTEGNTGTPGEEAEMSAGSWWGLIGSAE